MDWYNFCCKVCAVSVEKNFEPIGGIGKEVELMRASLGKGSIIRGGQLKEFGFLLALIRRQKVLFDSCGG